MTSNVRLDQSYALYVRERSYGRSLTNILRGAPHHVMGMDMSHYVGGLAIRPSMIGSQHTLAVSKVSVRMMREK